MGFIPYRLAVVVGGSLDLMRAVGVALPLLRGNIGLRGTTHGVAESIRNTGGDGSNGGNNTRHFE